MARRLTTVLLAFLFWTLLGMVFATQMYLSAAVLSHPIKWQHAFAYAVPGWYVWAALAPLVTWLGRIVPIRRERTLFAVLLHLTASALISLAHTVVSVALMFVTIPSIMGQGFNASLRFHIQLGTHLNILTYWAILGVSYAATYYRNEQVRELKATQLAAGLAQARLDALRMELNPHFLFNTLNTLSSLIYSNARAADQMIARLGDLLRVTLESRAQHDVSLEEELRFLKSYVDIEQVRFGQRLQVQFDVAPDVTLARVPTLLLQPIVENAIRHGIAQGEIGGIVRVAAHRASGRLLLTVSDNGPGHLESSNGHGIGLSNTRQRLTHMYGSEGSLEIAKTANGGSVVTITLPFASPA